MGIDAHQDHLNLQAEFDLNVPENSFIHLKAKQWEGSLGKVETADLEMDYSNDSWNLSANIQELSKDDLTVNNYFYLYP